MTGPRGRTPRRDRESARWGSPRSTTRRLRPGLRQGGLRLLQACGRLLTPALLPCPPLLPPGPRPTRLAQRGRLPRQPHQGLVPQALLLQLLVLGPQLADIRRRKADFTKERLLAGSGGAPVALGIYPLHGNDVVQGLGWLHVVERQPASGHASVQ